MDTLLMSLRYIEASIEGVMKKLEVLSVSTSDAQRCTEALNTFSIFNALSVLEEVTRDSMKTAVCKSGEKKQKAPYSAERSENNVADTSPVKLIKVENQSAVEEDSKVVQSSQLSDEDSANDESADGDDGTQTDDDVGDTGDVNDHEFKEEEEVHRRRRSGLRHIKKRSSREMKYSEDYSENKCKTCYKKFPNPTRLAIHMKSHDDSRPFRCHLCQKTFKYDRCLQQHLKVTHNDDRPEECEFCHKRFKMIVAGYILAVFQYQTDEQQRLTPGNTPIRRRGGSQMSQTPIDGHVTPGMVEYCQRLIQDDMCQQMFSITQKIQKKLAGSYGNARDLSSEFPVLPGSHLPLKHPALEFVKDVCQVLSLDSNINNQVIKMKRDLLKLIGVGEFSEEAQFADPCLSYVVPEVICKMCNHIRDLDLCRDPYLTYDSGTRAVWSCVQCKANYDLDEIEQSLIDAVERKSMGYVLQDLKCTKCNGIKETNLATHCKCAGDFTNMLSIDDFGQKLQTFRNIARHYNMTLLQETVDWILQMNPHITTVH